MWTEGTFKVIECCEQCLVVLDISALTERKFKVSKCCEQCYFISGILVVTERAVKVRFIVYQVVVPE